MYMYVCMCVYIYIYIYIHIHIARLAYRTANVSIYQRSMSHHFTVHLMIVNNDLDIQNCSIDSLIKGQRSGSGQSAY